jgi:hypothetical protein
MAKAESPRKEEKIEEDVYQSSSSEHFQCTPAGKGMLAPPQNEVE